MARSVASDYLHAFRFHVTADAVTLEGAKFLSRSTFSDSSAQAGFSAVNTPSGTIDAVEYREGQYIYTRKYPGIPTMDDVTMSRGVALTDTEFFFWFRTCVEGVGEYRTDLNIFHYHRWQTGQATLPGRVNPTDVAPEGLVLSSEARKVYKLFNAFPVAHKVATDLDGTASEVAIADLTVAYEHFDIREGAG